VEKATLMAAMRERRKREGLRQVLVWVPAGDVERLRKYAARLAGAAKQRRA
jgi:hypothetical protein